VQNEVPWWWRPFWGVATIVLLTLFMIEDDYAILIPSLVACCAGCFGFEGLAHQHGRNAPDGFDEHGNSNGSRHSVGSW